jgi:hypothetical protein
LSRSCEDLLSKSNSFTICFKDKATPGGQARECLFDEPLSDPGDRSRSGPTLKTSDQHLSRREIDPCRTSGGEPDDESVEDHASEAGELVGIEWGEE